MKKTANTSLKRTTKAMLKPLMPLSLCLILAACEQQQQSDPLHYQIAQKPFTIAIPAEGELFASESTSITTPSSRSGIQTLLWLKPEYSMVKKGDVIARFDAETLLNQRRDRQHQANLNAHDIDDKLTGLKTEQSAITQDLGLIDTEKDFAEQFNIDDVQIRSRLEILDSMENTEFLTAKQTYLQWKNNSFAKTQEGEMGLLNMIDAQHQAKIDELDQSLNQLEVLAPQDGLLTYKADWRGEKPREGKAVWPGQKLAELPDINSMKAKLYVREHEALGLQAEQSVRLSINAYPGSEFTATVESIAPFPQSIKRGDPQKYFEVIVAFAEQNALFKPGLKLTASIHIANDARALIVPKQSVFSKDNQSYVYLSDGDEYVMQVISMGRSSLSHVEVLAGLQSGDKISLLEPNASKLSEDELVPLTTATSSQGSK